LAAFAIQNVDVPSAADIDAHYAQANPPIFLLSDAIFLLSDAAGTGTDLMDVWCMIPLMWVAPPRRLVTRSNCWWRRSPRYACVAAGTVGTEVNQSMVATDWPNFARGTEYNQWADGIFCAVYRLAKRPPAGAAPHQDYDQRMAEAIIIGMKGATAAEKEKQKKFANHEKLKILAACGLQEGDWDQVPPFMTK
jgi:hypothetical protein